jgi:hypothetical protein
MVKKKDKWFIKIRGSYLPNSWQGRLLYVPFLAYLLVVLRYAVQNSETILDGFYIIFPQFVAAAVVMTWIASKKS